MQEAVGEAEFLKLVEPNAVVVDERRIGRDEAHADAARGHLRGDREARGPGAHDEHVHGRVVRQRLEDVDDGSLVLENLSLLKLDPLAVGSKLGRLLRLVDVPAGDELGEVDARAADGLGGGVCLLVRVRPGDRALARDGGELGLLKHQPAPLVAVERVVRGGEVLDEARHERQRGPHEVEPHVVAKLEEQHAAQLDQTERLDPPRQKPAPDVLLHLEERLEELPGALDVELHQRLHAEAHERSHAELLVGPHALPHPLGNPVGVDAGAAARAPSLQLIHEGVDEGPDGQQSLRHHEAGARVNHTGGAADAERPLRERGEDAAHGDEAVFLLLHGLDLDAHLRQALLELNLEVVKLQAGPFHQRRLLEEDLRLGERHGVQERGVLAVHLLVPRRQVLVAPVHEQHGVQVQPVRPVRLAHDPERSLVPRRELALELHQLARVARRVQDHLRVHLSARELAISAPLERHHRSFPLVRDALHRARAEHHALVHAPLQKLIFQRDAVHLTVRPEQVDAVGSSVVDDHLRPGPHLVEAIGQAEVLKLVHPHAVVVLPALERGRVDEGDAEALGGRAVRRAEARGAASDDDEVEAVQPGRLGELG